MKLELCHFSQQKIYPSRGKKFVRVDGKTFNFANGKSEKSYFMKRNPRKTSWTVVYRRKHKKGTIEEVSKKRTAKKTIKFQRGFGGATLEDILSKRNQNPEVRKKQREQAIKAAKEKAASKKKSEVQKAGKSAQQKVQKSSKKQTPRGSGGTSRGGQKR